ncbi:helix-turn-helix domain-containing protein, partial [Bacillus subtilis]
IVILPVDQSTMTTRGDAEKPTEPTDESPKTTNEPSDSINLSKNHVIDTVPACGLKNALPSEIYSAMARYFEADEIYKY